MENVIVVSAANDIATELAAARIGAAEAQRAAYGANTRYALALNQVFAFDWFDLSGTDTSDEGKQVRKEKGMFFEALKAINPDHTNPSTIWARIRSVAKLQRYPAPTKISAEAGEVAEAEAGESGASHNRSPMLRNVEELTALYKFNARQESLDTKVHKAQLKIGEALQALGIDLNMVNAK
jgi:hypothetical protein